MARPKKIHETPLEPFNAGPKGGQVPRCQFVRYGKHPKAGIQCKGNALRGGKYCAKHPGARNHQMIGPANGNWKGGVTKTGRWTSILSGANQDSYVRALQDPDFLSLDSEIALIDVRLEELVRRADQHSDWPAMRIAYDRLVKAMAESDSAMIRSSLQSMRDLVYGVAEADKQWEDVVALTERRKMLAESERKRMVEQNMYLTREQAQMHARALLEIVTRHIKERDTLVAIMTDFRMVMEAGRALQPSPV